MDARKVAGGGIPQKAREMAVKAILEEGYGVAVWHIPRAGRLIAKVNRAFTNQKGAAITRWEEYSEWVEAHKREYNEPPLPDAPHVPDVAEAAERHYYSFWRRDNS